MARRTSAEAGSASSAAAVPAAAADFAAEPRRRRTCTCRPTQTGSGEWRLRSVWRPGRFASVRAVCHGGSEKVRFETRKIIGCELATSSCSLWNLSFFLIASCIFN